MEFFPSQRGSQKLASGGYVYTKDRSYETYSTWCCERSRLKDGKQCLGRVKLADGALEVVNEHSHLPDLAHVQAEVAKANLYASAARNQVSARTMVTTAVQGLPHAAVAKLPSLNNMADALRMKRRKAGAAPPNPTTLSELQLDEENILTARGDSFLLHDSGAEDENRIVIFGTEQNVEILGRCNIWSADGTFKTCPNLFKQLWVIHGYYRGSFLPLFYVLMPNQREETYVQVLEILSNREIPSPRILLQDFELSELNAFKQVFPEITVKGCWFHYAQCIFRKVRELGHANEYSNNGAFESAIKLFMSLPFVKISDICRYYEAAGEKLEEVASADFHDDFLSYMDFTWIGVPTRGRRRSPRYKFETWNVYESVINGDPRTNNASEGWHNAFHLAVGSNHPTVFKFINEITREQGRTEARIVSLDAGERQTQSQKYKIINDKYSNIIEAYDTYSPLDYLKSISYNFNL